MQSESKFLASYRSVEAPSNKQAYITYYQLPTNYIFIYLALLSCTELQVEPVVCLYIYEQTHLGTLDNTLLALALHQKGHRKRLGNSQ